MRQKPDRRFPVGGRETGVGADKALADAVDPERAIGVEQGFDDISFGKRRRDGGAERALQGGTAPRLRKGSKIYLEGQLETRKWTDNAGVEKYSTEVVLRNYNSSLTMLDGRSEGGGGADYGGGRSDYGGGRGGGGRGGYGGGRDDMDQRRPTEDFSADMDDEIPF